MQKYLIVVDMQNDFVDAALGSEQALKIAPAVAERIRSGRQSLHEEIWFTMDTHDEHYLSTQEGDMLPVPHCIKGTDGWAMFPLIKNEMTKDMRVFEKPTFGSERMVNALVEEARMGRCPGGRGMYIELCGVCTDICVVSNALMIKAALPEAILSVQSHLCAGLSPERHESALEVMRSCQINVRA